MDSQLSAFHPEIFQDRFNALGGDEEIAFEAWSYKLIGPYTDDIIMVIPGIFHNRRDPSASEAFISVVLNTKVNYYRFPITKFKASKQTSGFTVMIGDSTFTPTSITLSIMPTARDDAPDTTVMGEISFSDVTPWPTTLTTPNSNGLRAWLTSATATHTVLSMHHKVHGYIAIGEELTDLEMGSGYIERASFGGRSEELIDTFVWAQSDHFALLKPPKRGKGPGGDGEVWAESEENTEEVREDGPGAGDASGAISALYADHVHNHEQPVSLFVNIERQPLPVPKWARDIGLQLGLTADDFYIPSFVAGFLYQNRVHTFGHHELDSATMELEVSVKDEGKEIIHLGFTDRSLTHHLAVQLHKPIQINASGRRKKDTECLKKAISQKNRERERLGGHLNPLEEAFLMDDIANPNNKKDASTMTPEEIAMQEALEAGIAAEKANTPEAKLKALYDKPIPTPAPIIAHMYGPKDGKMTKSAYENLIGGRIELQWNELLSASDYSRMSSKERKSKDWKQQIVGSDVMYAAQLYRAIGKPASLSANGDIDWLIDQIERRNIQWRATLIEWIALRRNTLLAAIIAGAVIATAIVLQVLTSCCCGGKKTKATKVKTN